MADEDMLMDDPASRASGSVPYDEDDPFQDSISSYPRRSPSPEQEQAPAQPESVSEIERAPRKKREKKPQVQLERQLGKSLFPVSRVQKIIKADKEIPIVSKEANFLISRATEAFIERLCESAAGVAQRSNRATVQHRDLATVVRKADEFLFLEDIIPWSLSDAVAPKKKTKKVAVAPEGQSTLATHFKGKGKEQDDGPTAKPGEEDDTEDEDEDEPEADEEELASEAEDADGKEDEDEDVVMNEDESTLQP
ncbi:histone-fold-containing protein [Cylindrobasidium torrendii FP15055 ss-10]|uniref:Histone-fold-containing protein n=1 Tax=Cylindrobasidium torrendii FP15055 ss-10 TaxID=1314674 RepID=A0A0D7AT88_9AGAR|nr:histone-fold-containing protein [Cylindrobasidium torrendii FP15055 ss-10]